MGNTTYIPMFNSLIKEEADENIVHHFMYTTHIPIHSKVD